MARRIFPQTLSSLCIYGLTASGSALASDSCPGTHNDRSGAPVIISDSSPDACLPANAFEADPDVSRNQASLSSKNICVKHDDFEEAGRSWHLLIVQSRAKPGNVFWVVPHNNEHSGFDTAVFGLSQFGGTMVAVRTGGQRCNGMVDPNRNFDDGSGPNCTHHPKRSPIYTEHILRWRPKNALVIALHSNEIGFSGDNHGGEGNISIHIKSATLYPSVGRPKPLGKSPDDTMVYVSSSEPPGHDQNATAVATALNQLHINVQYEVVSQESNDCSLSNYSVLHKFPIFHNLETLHGDSSHQQEILVRLAKIIGLNKVTP